MVAITITLDTQTACKSDIDEIVRNGEVVRVTGVINTQWEEFSAIELARKVGVQDVEWDVVHDDTPGSICLWMLYPCDTWDEASQRLLAIGSVDDYMIGLRL
jgi:hypothetical protein